MQRFARSLVLLLLALWLPTTLHCELEGADVPFLTHDHDEHAPACHDNGPDAVCHAFEDAAFTASAPLLKVPLPGDSLSVVLAALVRACADTAEPSLFPGRQPPPPELTVGWHFVRRAAPSPRAPSVIA